MRFLNVLATVLLILFCHTLFAEVKLPAIVSSNMVLQRNTSITIWGWADAGEKITIKTSWSDNLLQVVTDKKGDWQIEMQTTNSTDAQTIHIKSKKSDILLENILFGEVWFCSGQSNMEMPMKGFSAQPVYGSNLAIVKSLNANLRLFKVEKHSSMKPLTDLVKYESWEQASPNNVASFSAIAYYFGEQLQEVLDVPVGIILSSWGGSRIEAWMSQEAMLISEEDYLAELDTTLKEKWKPTALYNAMINPLIPFAIKGVLWYQGESNRKHPEQYKVFLPNMVADWRDRWKSGEFSFYQVQIAPFKYKTVDAFGNLLNTALMREAQIECGNLIPNSGTVVTLDVGDPNWIHPPYKKEVADRLLYNALNQTYGFSTIDYLAPSYDSLELKDAGLLLSFNNNDAGLYAYGEINNFEIAGNDKVFYPAKASIISRKQLFVQSDKVVAPVAVRYGWSNWVKASLFGANLLPVTSFRTDKWDDATRYGPEE